MDTTKRTNDNVLIRAMRKYNCSEYFIFLSAYGEDRIQAIDALDQYLHYRVLTAKVIEYCTAILAQPAQTVS